MTNLELLDPVTPPVSNPSETSTFVSGSIQI